jgi:hypothetical protein
VKNSEICEAEADAVTLGQVHWNVFLDVEKL